MYAHSINIQEPGNNFGREHGAPPGLLCATVLNTGQRGGEVLSIYYSAR